jgi:PAS domain S-box-containing protein
VLWLGFTALLSLCLISAYRKSIKYKVSEAQAQSLLSITKQNELEFSSAFEYASIGMALVSTEGKWIRVNKSLCDLLGYEESELLARTFQDITHPDDLEKDLDYVKQMLLGKIASYQMEKRYFTKSGDLVWVLLAVSLVRDSGQPKHFISQIQNITQRKKLQDLIQVEKQRLQQIIKGTDAGTWEWNVQTGEVIFNEKWANLIGYTLEELEPVSIETWMKFTHPEDLEESSRRLQECFEKKEFQYKCACRMKHKAGHWVWIMDRGKVFSWTEEGLPELMFGSHIDISGMKELEEKLNLERQKFYSIFNSTFQFIGFLDLDGTLLEANQTALEFAGLVPEDVIGKKFWDCYWWQISSETQHHLKQAIETALTGQDVKYEVAVWDKAKNPVTILFNLKPLKDLDGKVLAVIPEGTPIQDIVDARTALITSNQELEDFASVAAHDLKEPLRAISQFLTRLNQRNEELFDEKSKRDIHFVLDGAKRMDSLIQDLLEYAQIGSKEAAFEQINLNQTLEEVMGLMASVIEEKNAIVTISELPSVWAQPTGMKLLFQNLLGNALKYQSQNSQPEITIASEEFENHFVISVKDNGIGMSPINLSKIFNRFSRLHSSSAFAGVGMGLATCKKIADIHQAKLEVGSELGKGSIFYFKLPKNIQYHAN